MAKQQQKNSNLSPAERLLASKRAHVKKLRAEIIEVRRRADDEVARIEGRIAISEALIYALKNGTLKVTR